MHDVDEKSWCNSTFSLNKDFLKHHFFFWNLNCKHAQTVMQKVCINVKLKPSVKYVPAAKAFPFPVKTTAPMLLSFWRLDKASWRSTKRAPHRAFNALGRFNEINPTFLFSPTVSTTIFSYSLPPKKIF